MDYTIGLGILVWFSSVKAFSAMFVSAYGQIQHAADGAFFASLHSSLIFLTLQVSFMDRKLYGV
jgi:hypothetical protein